MHRPHRAEADRFFEKVEKTPDCWLWTGARSPAGHGVFRRANGKTCPAHHWVFEQFLGSIPPKIRVLRSCGGSSCVHPEHLFLGTPENMLRRKSKPGENGCVEWTGSTLAGGYGTVGIGGKNILVHRLAYELANGPIPDGQCALHKCDNRVCINPDHLFLGTKTENNEDMVKKNRHARGTSLSNITEIEVQSMRILYENGVIIADIAKLTGKRHNTISGIVHRRTWKHI